jgi:predicted dehydrogenase
MNVGIVGAGNMGQRHHIPGWMRLPDVKVTAVCDVDIDRARSVASEFEIPHAVDDFRELADMDLDVVDICTPNMLHFPAAKTALTTGKHVLCEKPLAVTADEVRKLGSLADAGGLKLMTAQMRRFSGDAMAIKKWIDKGNIGQVYYARVRAMRRDCLPGRPGFIDSRLSGGGPGMDMGVHALDMCLWLIDFPTPVRVSGIKRTNFGKGTDIKWKSEWDRNIFDVEDFAAGFVQFDNGTAMIIEAAWLGHQTVRIDVSNRIFGLRGGVSYPSGEYTAVVNGEQKDGTIDPIPLDEEVTSYDREIEALHDAIVHDKPSPVPWQQTLKVIQILEGIYMSDEQGCEIALVQ